jgi:hypothetical protein
MTYGDEFYTDITKSLPFKVGDSFIYTKDPAQKKPVDFEGELLTVVGFTPLGHKDRIVLRNPEGKQIVFSLDYTRECFERARKQS